MLTDEAKRRIVKHLREEGDARGGQEQKRVRDWIKKGMVISIHEENTEGLRIVQGMSPQSPVMLAEGYNHIFVRGDGLRSRRMGEYAQLWRLKDFDVEKKPMITRRGLIAGLGSILAAPAIVRASSLMPIKPWVEKGPYQWVEVPYAPKYLNGPYGNIPVRFAVDIPRDSAVLIGASEPIYKGDVVIIENGLVRRASVEDMTASGIVGRALGVAQSTTPLVPVGWVGGPEFQAPAGSVVRYWEIT